MVLSTLIIQAKDDTSIGKSDSVVNQNNTKTWHKSILLSDFFNLKGQKRKPVASFILDEEKPKESIFKKNLQISGIARIISIYRNMDTYYEDMITSEKNFSFTDYPVALSGASFLGGYPNLELNVQSKITNDATVNVGYSMSHGFSGQTTNDAGKSLSSLQNLRFGGKLNTSVAKFNLNVGSVLWTKLSRFTLGQTEYRDDYFDRLPWDWYRKSFLRYEEYHGLGANVGAQGGARSPIMGFVGNIDIFPRSINITMVLGRTNLTSTDSRKTLGFPEMVYGARVEKNFFVKSIDARVGANFYTRRADTDKSRGIQDNNELYTVDGNIRIRKTKFFTELAYGKINTPHLRGGEGFGGAFRVDFDKRASPVPFSIEVYRIDKNIVSIDGSIINSNSAVRGGGYATEFIYDVTRIINAAQEVGQYANNRMGISLNAEKKFGKLAFQFGTNMSQEIENLSDTISMQHRMVSFTRSRFRPWYQAGGNYGRIRSLWRRTYETMIISDDGSDYKKGYNGVELLTKYRVKFLTKDFVLMNLTTFNSIQKNFSGVPVVTDRAFARTLFTEITVACKLTNKYTIVVNGGIERLKGNNKTLANPDNGNPTADAIGVAADQHGETYGIGVDYDFSSTAGLHIRHRWFNHQDFNLVLDKFKGSETMFELKLFF